MLQKGQDAWAQASIETAQARPFSRWPPNIGSFRCYVYCEPQNASGNFSHQDRIYQYADFECNPKGHQHNYSEILLLT